MDYKYRKGQIFGKRLRVPKSILNKVYSCTLSFDEYIEYELDDKVPTSCIIEFDRRIVEKFGVGKCKELDWELINKRGYYNINFRDILMTIDAQTEDINLAFYELIKNLIKPNDYSPRMKEIYSDRLFDILSSENDYLRSLMQDFNNGKIGLKTIIDHWRLFEEKDISYCLLEDRENKNNITASDLKEFMSNYRTLVPLIVDNDDIYTFISESSKLTTEEEKKQYMRKFTDEILANTHREYWDHRPPIELTDDEYKEIFKYSSLEDHLKRLNQWETTAIIEELKTLPEDYVFNISVPFSALLNYDVLSFIGIYGLKNVVDFNDECGQFFTNNNCQMLKLMNDMYLHYGGNEHDPNKTIFTRNIYDENGNIIDRPYTKDEFYEAMRRMIIYGPSDWNFVDKAPDYRNMTGEFRIRNAKLFISEQAPEELQNLFYTKSITPVLLVEHPEYIEYLKGKDLSSCFKSREVYVEGSNALSGYENFYKFLGSKTDFNSVMEFITEYSDILDAVFDRSMPDSYQYKTEFSIEDDISQIQKRINDSFRRLIIEKGLIYPRTVPQSLRENYPSMFLSSDSPKELQETFYSRTANTDFILSNPNYRKYLERIDLEILYKYMPVSIVKENDRYGKINLVSAVKQTFSTDDSFDIMLLYGKYIESVFEINRLQNFKLKSNFSKNDLLDEIDKCILQTIINGEMKYDENIPTHFKSKNPTMFLSDNVSKDIRKKFYNREFTINDFTSNPELLEVFGETNIVCGFSEDVAWMIPLFNGNENLKEANYNRLKVISTYSKIQDVALQQSFKEYVVKFGENIDIEKIEYVSEVLSRLSLSNSSEIYTFRKELSTQVLNATDPIESLNKIEDIFIRNTIPTFGKIYSCFEILHPNFEGFNFDNSRVSPVLQKSSSIQKKVIIFSDLMKASFGSNNRSVRSFLENIEAGNNLYESIKKGEIRYETLDEAQQKKLINFSKIISTLYNNTVQNRKIDEFFNHTGDVILDLSELSKRLSPNGTSYYNLRR